MTNLEIIERLCAVVDEQSKIIKEQATFIEEQHSVDEANKAEFAEKRAKIYAEIDEIYNGTATAISQ